MRRSIRRSRRRDNDPTRARVIRAHHVRTTAGDTPQASDVADSPASYADTSSIDDATVDEFVFFCLRLAEDAPAGSRSRERHLAFVENLLQHRRDYVADTSVTEPLAR